METTLASSPPLEKAGTRINALNTKAIDRGLNPADEPANRTRIMVLVY